MDFEELRCGPGTLLVLSPGQTQRFDARSRDWQGWVVICRPEFLQGRAASVDGCTLAAPNRLDDLAVNRTLRPAEREAVTEHLERMARDARLRGEAAVLHALLRHQLQAVLARLHLNQAGGDRGSAAAPALAQRFARFRRAVEQELHRLHRVADYATLIGCSERSLQRATGTIAGTSAKSFLSQRIALEAKRLLVHTGDPVAHIADRLGFDEASNFVKFFRREAGMPPGDFRRQHASR